ncbi:MAG: hypothetical protein ABW171_16425 [Steroidobacter sp.]
MNWRGRAWLLIPVIAAVGVLGWAAFTPVRVEGREKVFAIPEGTWARRRAGDNIDILPPHIRLTLGLDDVLLLKNRDSVPQTFGPALLMPGQNFRLPFEVASEYQFACTAHSSGQMTVIVDPFPASPFARVKWRVTRLVDSIRYRYPNTTT